MLVSVTGSPLQSLSEIDHLERRQAELQLNDGTTELVEQDADFESLDQAASPSFQTSQARVPTGAIAKILAAANARPTAIDRSPGYGKRSAESEDEISEPELVEQDADFEPLDQAASPSFQTSQARVPTGAIAKILAAANARPTAIDRSPGYGKRSAESEDEISEPELVEQDANSESLDQAASPSFKTSQARVPTGAIARILAVANAEPKAIDRSPGYGKRSAETKDETENKVGLVSSVPLDAVKLKIHSSHGNIAQQFDGDLQYQNAVLGGRFGRGRTKREGDNFIPFSVYDERRVKTLKLEQNDFLALPERLQTKEKKKRHFSENSS